MCEEILGCYCLAASAAIYLIGWMVDQIQYARYTRYRKVTRSR